MMSELAFAVESLAVEEFWQYAVLSVIASGAGLYYYFRFLSHYRAMEDTPTSLIRSAAQGYNEFKGVAQMLPGEPIIAPLTKLPCVWYSYKVEEKQSHYVRGRSRVSWSVYESGVSDGLFVLQGETGKAIINPDDAEVTHSVSDNWSGSTPSPSVGPKGLSARSFIIGRRYRYSEQRIHAGDALYVLGDFKSFREAALPTNNELLSSILSDWKRNPEAILNRFDKNKDGKIDPEEWSKAVLVAKEQLKKAPEKKSEAQIDNIIEQPTHSRKPFLISTQDESVLLQKLKYKSSAALLLFFAAGVATVWMFNVRFL